MTVLNYMGEGTNVDFGQGRKSLRTSTWVYGCVNDSEGNMYYIVEEYDTYKDAIQIDPDYGKKDYQTLGVDISALDADKKNIYIIYDGDRTALVVKCVQLVDSVIKHVKLSKDTGVICEVTSLLPVPELVPSHLCRIS